MKLHAIIGTCLLLGIVNSAPTSDEDQIVIDEDFFPDVFVVYSGKYDIVNILVPANDLNFADDDDSTDTILFFTEADKDANGKRVDKGLYILKGNVTTKLLEHGREATADSDHSKTAYFAAKDGIYKYNAEENKAEKYGTIDDSIIGIAKVNATDLIYILTEDNILYKITEEGTKKEKVPEVVDAQQIVLDLGGNLYYYTANKEVYVYNGDGIKKIQGLKANPSSIDLLKPLIISDDGIPAVVEDQSYLIYPNGTAEVGDFKLQAKPTAYAIEGTLLQYYGYNKKIYEYNLVALLLLDGLLEEMKKYVYDKTDGIEDLSTMSRAELKSGAFK